ncbi:uncharacterized protein LOC132172136 [Corylus avellana]|uniref:uncharacterized protein LOC132172136 n=1 Tax=Corylus avellana TaxID=13451 RepID=UPI00286C4D2E|nr:uncharacterized protein LOC132172136 [Corylus avellana]
MEDPSEEWKIEEYGGKMRWILNKGLILGRKILITGIVVSSAPIVLPPILALSVIGFVVSVPSGFLLASYACSEMLMRKLLPNDEEEVYWDEEKEEEGVGFGGEYYTEKEEEELMEETKRRVEMRIELVEEEVGENNEDVVEYVEENEYEEDGDEEYLDEEEKPLEERIEVIHCYGRGEMKGEVEALKEEEAPKVREKMLQTRYVENIDSMPKEVESIVLEGTSFDNNVQVEKPIVVVSETINEEMKKGKDVDNITEAEISTGHGNEEQKSMLDKATVFQAGRAEGNYVTHDVALDFKLNRNKENVIFSNIDVREMADESGLDLFDDKNVAGQQCSYVVHGTAKESSVGRDATESVELSVSAVVHEPNHNGLPSKKDIIAPSSEVLYNEEKIWEKIEAMRSIVGYKAMPQKTCIEEVKALYIFTGVEPPTSFKDPTSDLGEVYDRLHFLMSIVGVK